MACPLRVQRPQENWRELVSIRLVDSEAIRAWSCSDSSGMDLAVEVRESSMPDFSNWKDQGAFDSAFEHLWKDLMPDGGKTESEAWE